MAQIKAVCCQATITVPDDVEIAEVIVCDQCTTELEVVSTDPILLQVFEEEEK